MKSQSILLVLALFFVIGIGFSTYTVIEFKDARKSVLQQSLKYVKKNNYLKRSLRYKTLISFDELSSTINSKKYIVYFSGHTCASCAESLLNLLKNEYNLVEDCLILIDDNSKKEFVLNYNDAFQAKYNFVLQPLTPINEIILLKISKDNIEYILEYKPAEESFFKECFNYLN